MSKFMVQIVDAQSGEVVHSWAPGLAVERHLVEELSERLVAKGVGVFRTSAHVKQACIDALNELLRDLKSQV